MLDETEKYSICIQVAQIFATFHEFTPPMCHGHLTSHNVLLEIQANKHFKVRIGDLELMPIYNVANMFGDYRNASVWSSPEVLQNMKKICSEPTREMDVYSFSMLVWELWHETIPFDGDLTLCQQYVVNEDSRPMIETEKLNSEITKLIRLCWQKQAE